MTQPSTPPPSITSSVKTKPTHVDVAPSAINAQTRAEQAQPALDYELTGVPQRLFSDIYYYLLAANWGQLLGIGFAAYLLVNFLFAVLYWFGLDGVSSTEPGSFADAFFFSVQTFSTIGYGTMSPISFYTNLLVTIESFFSIVSIALATGLIFAKFSRPSARVAYSKKMVINHRNGEPTLQFRIANERRNQIINASLTLSVLADEFTAEGEKMRRFRELTLERDSSPLFAMSWLAIHKLDESSPLYGVTPETIAERMSMIVSSFEGLDATFLQTVQARHFYRPADLAFDARFADMIEHKEEGKLALHLENLSNVRPILSLEDDSNNELEL